MFFVFVLGIFESFLCNASISLFFSSSLSHAIRYSIILQRMLILSIKAAIIISFLYFFTFLSSSSLRILKSIDFVNLRALYGASSNIFSLVTSNFFPIGAIQLVVSTKRIKLSSNPISLCNSNKNLKFSGVFLISLYSFMISLQLKLHFMLSILNSWEEWLIFFRKVVFAKYKIFSFFVIKQTINGLSSNFCRFDKDKTVFENQPVAE